MTDPIDQAAKMLRTIDGSIESDAEQRSLVEFISATQHPRRWWPRIAIATGGVLAVAIAAIFVFGVFAPLTYTVDGTHEGSWVRATEVPASIRFSEGTAFELEPNGSAEITSIDARGAVVRVSSGVLTAKVIHRNRARWSVQAGPYTVRVTGTRFTTRHVVDDEVEVELFEGSVEITGPGLVEPIQLTPGQRFRASLESTGARVEVSRLDAVDAAAVVEETPDAGGPDEIELAPEPVRRPPAKRPPFHKRPGVTAPVISTPTPEPTLTPPMPMPVVKTTWRERVALGQFKEVVQEAQGLGLDVELRDRGVEEVFALGEAARYVGQSMLATRSFSVVRQRAPNSHHAAHAALLLGRVAEQQGQWSQANRWYELCETEGTATLAPEAVGRRILVLQHLGLADDAKAAARRYRALDPSGPWTEVARRMLE